MKTSKYILIILIVAIVAFSIIHKKKADESLSTGTETESTELCYIWNTEAGDKASLRMNVAFGGAANGTFDWIPAEKDSKRGPFEGVAHSTDEEGIKRIMKGWWSASAEGATVTEELHIRFDEKTAAAGFGEMKDRGDGTYVYADTDALSYVPTLQSTDCDDPAL